MKQGNTLGFAVATVEAGLLDNDHFVQQLSSLEGPVVIVNQYASKTLDAALFPPHVKVINTQSRGLSISRNLALESMDADFVMICDDDITLVQEGLEYLRGCLLDHPDVAMFFTQLQKTEGEAWRADYEKASFVLEDLSLRTKRRIQKINSMEQVYNLHFLRSEGLQFDPLFGAGSPQYCLGEETLMSWSVLKAGGALKYLPIVTRIHPPFSSGTRYSGHQMKSVLAMYRRIFGALSIPLFLVYCAKIALRILKR